MKTFQLTNLTTEEAILLDISLGVMAKEAPSGSSKYKELQVKIEKQFEKQD